MNRKVSRKIFLIILILFISIGFAYLSTNLYINGTSLVKGTSWSVYFANIDNENSTYQINNNATISSDKKSVEFEVTFEKPTDEYSFYVDVVNNGNLDAMLDIYEITGLTTDQAKYLEWHVTYADKTSLSKYDLLRKNSYDTFFIKVNFIEDVNYSDLPQDSDVTVNLRFKVVYVQADSNFQVSRNRTQYTITYNLDGGVIENNPTTYYQGDRVVIPNPTKEGYTFAGWTVGKNFLNLNLGSETINQTWYYSAVSNDWMQRTNNQYPKLIVNNKYTITAYFIKNNYNYKKTIHFWFDIPTNTCENNVGLATSNNYRNSFIFTAEKINRLRIAFDSPYGNMDVAIKFQIEEGEESTEWEPYISTPTKDIVLPKGSNGNRTYVANWVAN